MTNKKDKKDNKDNVLKNTISSTSTDNGVTNYIIDSSMCDYDFNCDVQIMYHDPGIIHAMQKDGSDWIDLRAAEDVTMVAGEYKLISLGISVKLPPGYEMIIVPRSSTFKNFKIIQPNSPAIIDNAYNTSNDIIKYPVYAMEDTQIFKNDRICQFRIQRNQPKINFVEVSNLDGESRGGFGSTGVG